MMAELTRAKAAGARLIGVNNRDLRTFDTTLDTTFALLESDARRELSSSARAALKIAAMSSGSPPPVLMRSWSENP